MNGSLLVGLGGWRDENPGLPLGGCCGVAVDGRGMKNEREGGGIGVLGVGGLEYQVMHHAWWCVRGRIGFDRAN